MDGIEGTGVRTKPVSAPSNAPVVVVYVDYGDPYAASIFRVHVTALGHHDQLRKVAHDAEPIQRGEAASGHSDLDEVERLFVFTNAAVVIGVLGDLVVPALHKSPGLGSIWHLFPKHERAGEISKQGVTLLGAKRAASSSEVDPWHSDAPFKLFVCINRETARYFPLACAGIGIGMSVAMFQTQEDSTHSKTMTKGDGSIKPP